MNRCPHCGAELDANGVGGLCPGCLMAEALETVETTGAGIPEARPVDRRVQAEVEGDRFGPYRILRRIGEGGMGSVYLAEQTRPIHRQVALKVVKLGMDTRQVVARFETERQSLALMDHPNIAHVFDAGTSDRGRPYFAMEYVDGVAITQYCDEHLLNTRERLQLFGPVCLALQHAHQKGVIHRDIKPSNVLITDQDGKPLPKVIDFGIAKATDQRLAEHAAFTLMGNFVGTPEYMSPEQADLSSRNIDTTTDVYSLGVLLYELLVGALPFDGSSLRAAGMAELLRIIREEEAPTPSAKLTKMGGTVTEVARCRRTDPTTLRRMLTGDLNWIVMKALEKDRLRRYASVSELAADICRHLDDQPVLAGPPGSLYRTRKFIRRHRVWVTAGVLVAASLVGGMIAVSWEARVAESRRREAEVQRTRADDQAAQALRERSRAEEKAREADKERGLSEEHRLEADAERRQAEELFGGVRDLAKSMIFDVADQIADLQGATAARESLIGKSLEYLDRLSRNPLATPELRRELAEAYLKIGDLQGRPGRASLADSQQARESYTKAISLVEALLKTRPHEPRLTHLLIQAYQRRAMVQETGKAFADVDRASRLASDRVEAEPESQEALHDLAGSLGTFSRWYATVPTAIPGARPSPSSKWIILRQRAALEGLLKRQPNNPETRRELATTYQDEGTNEINGDRQRSLASYSKALEQFEALAHEFPSNASYRREQAMTLASMSGLLPLLNRDKEGIEYARRSVLIQRQLVDGDPRNASFRLDLVHFLHVLASRQKEAGNPQEALRTYKEAEAVAERLLVEQPANSDLRYELATVHSRTAAIANSAGDPKLALDLQRKAEQLLEEVIRQHPNDPIYHNNMGTLHSLIGPALVRTGDRPGALRELRQIVPEYEQAAAAGMNRSDSNWSQVAYGHYSVSYGLSFLGDSDGASEEAAKAILIYDRVLAAHPEQAREWELVATLSPRAADHLQRRDWRAVIESARKALPVFETAHAAGSAKAPNSSSRDPLPDVLQQMAEAYTALGDFPRAIEARRRLVLLREQAKPADASHVRITADEIASLATALWESGDRQGCLDATLHAIALLDQFPRDELKTVSSHQNIDSAYMRPVQQLYTLHEIQRSLAVSRQRLSLWQDFYRDNSQDSTVRQWRESVQIALSLGIRRTGDFAESLKQLQEVAELRAAGHRDPASKSQDSATYVPGAIAVVQGLLGDRVNMEQGLRKTIDLTEQNRTRHQAAWQKNPDDAGELRQLLNDEVDIIHYFVRLGDLRQALDYGEKAVVHQGPWDLRDPYFRSSTDSRPETVMLKWQLDGERADYTGLLGPTDATPQRIRYFAAHGYSRVGSLLAGDGREDSMSAYHKSVSMFEALLKEDPRNTEYRVSMALAERNLGEGYLTKVDRRAAEPADIGDARAHFERARRIALELGAEGLLPVGYTRLPGQLASDIATCELLIAKK